MLFHNVYAISSLSYFENRPFTLLHTEDFLECLNLLIQIEIATIFSNETLFNVDEKFSSNRKNEIKLNLNCELFRLIDSKFS